MGPSTVLVTSVERPERPEGTIEMLAANDAGAWIVQTPHLPFKAMLRAIVRAPNATVVMSGVRWPSSRSGTAKA